MSINYQDLLNEPVIQLQRNGEIITQTLQDLVTQCNDEEYYNKTDKLNLDLSALDQLYKGKEYPCRQIQIILFDVKHFQREDVESIISYEINDDDTITAILNDNTQLTLTHTTEQDQRIINVSNLEVFIENYQRIKNDFLQGCWISVVFQNIFWSGIRYDQQLPNCQ